MSDTSSVKAPKKAKRKVSDWAQLMFPPGRRGAPHDDIWKHNAAAALHKWEEHRHHAGAELELDEETYNAALAAASTLVRDAVKVLDRNKQVMMTSGYVPEPKAMGGK